MSHNVGDITGPLGIGCVGRELAIEYVVGYRQVMVAVGGHPESPQGAGGNRIFAHKAHQAMATDTGALFQEFSVQARATLGAFARMVLLSDRSEGFLFLRGMA